MGFLIFLIIMAYLGLLGPLLWIIIAFILFGMLFGGGFFPHHYGYGYGGGGGLGYLLPIHGDPLTIILIVVVVVLLLRGPRRY